MLCTMGKDINFDLKIDKHNVQIRLYITLLFILLHSTDTKVCLFLRKKKKKTKKKHNNNKKKKKVGEVNLVGFSLTAEFFKRKLILKHATC